MAQARKLGSFTTMPTARANCIAIKCGVVLGADPNTRYFGSALAAAANSATVLAGTPGLTVSTKSIWAICATGLKSLVGSKRGFPKELYPITATIL